MKNQPFYAVRVTVENEATGETFTRDYVRGEQRMGIDRFGQFALGNLLSIVSDGTVPITWRVEAIDFETVRQNRLYSHTTHRE